MNLIKERVSNLDAAQVRKLIIEDEYNDETQFWELLSVFGDVVNDETARKDPNFMRVCEDCMTYIVNKGDPGELLYSLLEQADAIHDNTKLYMFLNLIKTCIFRNPAKFMFSVELSLVTLSDCISSFQVVNDQHDLKMDTEDQPVDETDIVKAEQAVAAYIDFIEAIVNEMHNVQTDEHKSQDMKKCCAIEKYVLKIFDQPLASSDLSLVKDEVKPNARVLAEKGISLLEKLGVNIHEVVVNSLKHNHTIQLKREQPRDNSDISNECELVSVVALGCLIYLAHVEKVGNNHSPCLLSKLGLFDIHLPIIQELVAFASSTEVRRKGVALLEFHLQALKDEQILLIHEQLRRPMFYQILGSLFDIMIYSSSQKLRQQCVHLIAPFIQLFDAKCRHLIFHKLFTTLKHAGALGLCVQLLKDQIEQNLKEDMPENVEYADMNIKYFRDTHLEKLFDLITKLNDKAATDLVEHSDRVISVLNLIRFCVLRNPKSKDVLGIWTFLPDIEKTFLQDLYTGVDMLKTHFRQELELLDASSRGRGKEQPVDMCVSVGGCVLPVADKEEKVAIIQRATNTLDLIASLLARVSELIDMQRKK